MTSNIFIQQENINQNLEIYSNSKYNNENYNLPTARIDFLIDLISNKELRNEHYNLSGSLLKELMNDEYLDKSLYFIKVPFTKQHSIQDLAASSILKLIETKLDYFQLKYDLTQLLCKQLSIKLQCNLHINCRHITLITYIGTIVKDFEQKYPILEWNEKDEKMCCLVVSRKGVHFKDNSRIEQLLNKDINFLDIINDKDHLNRDYQIFGNFSQEQISEQNSGNQIILMDSNNCYYIQKIKEIKILSSMIKYFIKFSTIVGYDQYNNDILNGVINFLQQFKDTTFKKSLEKFVFQTRYIGDQEKFEDMQQGLFDINQNIQLRKQNYHGTPTYKGQKVQIPLLHWDPYLIREQIHNIILPFIKWIKLFTDEQIIQLVKAQVKVLQSDKNLFKFSIDEIQEIQRNTHCAVGKYLKQQCNMSSDKTIIDISSTIQTIKDLFIDKGISGDEIEKAYQSTFLNITEKQQTIQNQIQSTDLQIKFLLRFQQLQENEYKAYQNITKHMKNNLSIIHFVNEKFLKQLEKKDFELGQQIKIIVNQIKNTQDQNEIQFLSDQILKLIQPKQQQIQEQQNNQDKQLISNLRKMKNYPFLDLNKNQLKDKKDQDKKITEKNRLKKQSLKWRNLINKIEGQNNDQQNQRNNNNIQQQQEQQF